MCTTVVALDGTWIHSIDEMAARGWPVTPADHAFADEWFEGNSCLCGVDVHAILDRHGVEYSDDGTGFLDVVSVREGDVSDGKTDCVQYIVIAGLFALVAFLIVLASNGS